MPSQTEKVKLWAAFEKKPDGKRVEVTVFEGFNQWLYRYEELIMKVRDTRSKRQLHFTDYEGNELKALEIAKKFLVYFDEDKNPKCFITIVARRTSVAGLPSITFRLFIVMTASNDSPLTEEKPFKQEITNICSPYMMKMVKKSGLNMRSGRIGNSKIVYRPVDAYGFQSHVLVV